MCLGWLGGPIVIGCGMLFGIHPNILFGIALISMTVFGYAVYLGNSLAQTQCPQCCRPFFVRPSFHNVLSTKCVNCKLPLVHDGIGLL